MIKISVLQRVVVFSEFFREDVGDELLAELRDPRVFDTRELLPDVQQIELPEQRAIGQQIR